MVKITNGISEFEVTVGAFKTIFEKQGYSIVSNKENVEVEEEESDSKKDEFSEMIEKPMSQWTKEEVKRFIDKKGIDVSGVKSFNEVKERVKKYIEEEM